MSARLLATLLTAGRAAFGIGLLFYPRRVARSWLGDDVDRPTTEMLVRAVGARDLVIGAGGVVSLLRGEPAAGLSVTFARTFFASSRVLQVRWRWRPE